MVGPHDGRGIGDGAGAQGTPPLPCSLQAAAPPPPHFLQVTTMELMEGRGVGPVLLAPPPCFLQCVKMEVGASHWPCLPSLQAVTTEQMEGCWTCSPLAVTMEQGEKGAQIQHEEEEWGWRRSGGGPGRSFCPHTFPHDTGDRGGRGPGPSVPTVIVVLSSPLRLGWAAWGGSRGGGGRAHGAR